MSNTLNDTSTEPVQDDFKQLYFKKNIEYNAKFILILNIYILFSSFLSKLRTFWLI